jgi:hypothetical protein
MCELKRNPMRLLWKDITQHPVSAGAFLLCWIAVFAWTLMTWSHGMSDLAVSLQVIATMIAGGLVGWWRYPSREGLLVNGRRPAGAPLAGALVAITTVSIVFLREAVVEIASGDWRASNTADFVLSWLVASALLGAIGSVLALFGALVSGLFARYLKPSV